LDKSLTKRGLKLPVTNRAIVSWVAVNAIALAFAIMPTLAAAREFRVADTQEKAGMNTLTDFDRKPFEAAMTGIDAKARHDPATAELIERIRKVE
jgi:hypothetical protein